MKTYTRMLVSESAAVIVFTKRNNIATPRPESAIAAAYAWREPMRRVGSGRPLVRFISESSCASSHWLNAFAPPAERAVPISVIANSGRLNAPRLAMMKPASVVKTTSAVSRNFESSRTMPGVSARAPSGAEEFKALVF